MIKLYFFFYLVVAFNQIGEANVAAQEVTGYSGEDVPLEAPTNFTLNQIIDERSAILSWNPVNPDSVQGIYIIFDYLNSKFDLTPFSKM